MKPSTSAQSCFRVTTQTSVLPRALCLPGDGVQDTGAFVPGVTLLLSSDGQPHAPAYACRRAIPMAACPGSSPIFSQELAGCSWGLPQCQDPSCTQQTGGGCQELRGCRDICLLSQACFKQTSTKCFRKMRRFSSSAALRGSQVHARGRGVRHPAHIATEPQ